MFSDAIQSVCVRLENINELQIKTCRSQSGRTIPTETTTVGDGVNIKSIYYTIFRKVLCSLFLPISSPHEERPILTNCARSPRWGPEDQKVHTQTIQGLSVHKRKNHNFDVSCEDPSLGSYDTNFHLRSQRLFCVLLTSLPTNVSLAFVVHSRGFLYKFRYVPHKLRFYSQD